MGPRIAVVALPGLIVLTVLALFLAPLEAQQPGKAAIVAVNESSLTNTPGSAFTAAFRDGPYGPQLVVSGLVGERTTNGERLTEGTVELVVTGKDGNVLWEGSWTARPGTDLDWRVAVKPDGALDGALISQVVIRDRQVSTIESRCQAYKGADRDFCQRQREAEIRRFTDRASWELAQREARERDEREVQAMRREAEAKRQAAIRARKWPAHIEQAVIERRLVIGMTAEQARTAWGKPDGVNETITARGRFEQWIYGRGQYLHFENDILTSIHRSR
jgi:hypothetical protein